jgi:PilZ domain
MSKTAKTEPADAESASHNERRTETRHDAKKLGTVTARLIGGSEVRLVNFSNRGILVESDSRLLIGARASVRITTSDASVVVTGRVVRSRVKGLVNGVLVYDAGLNLDCELSLASADFLEEAAAPALAESLDATAPPSPESEEAVAVETWDETDLTMALPAVANRQTMDDEAMVQLFATVPQDLAELRRLAADNQW